MFNRPYVAATLTTATPFTPASAAVIVITQAKANAGGPRRSPLRSRCSPFAAPSTSGINMAPLSNGITPWGHGAMPRHTPRARKRRGALRKSLRARSARTN